MECCLLDSLDSLEQLSLQLFLPLLSCEDKLGESKFWGLKETCLMDRMGNELQSNMQKILSQVTNAKQCLIQSTKLTIPSLVPDCFDKTEVDYELLLELETAANDWLPVIEATVQHEARKIPVGKHPLSELDFWRDRVNTLSSLHGQLSSQRVKSIVAALEAASSNMELLQSLKSQYSDLNKMFLEAKDNVNFLTTLERHFKHSRIFGIFYTSPWMEEVVQPVFQIQANLVSMPSTSKTTLLPQALPEDLRAVVCRDAPVHAGAHATPPMSDHWTAENIIPPIRNREAEPEDMTSRA